MTNQPQTPIRLGRRRLVLGGLGLGGTLAIAPLLSACSDDDDSPSAGGQGGTPRTGGRLRVGVTDVPPTYELGSSGASWGASYQAFAWPLYHGGSAQGLEISNGLADGYEAATDGLTHTVTVRDRLTFHDGSPITAEAVAECLRSQMFADHPLRDEGPYNQTTAGFGSPPVVARIDVTGPLSLQIVLSQPRADIRQSVTQTYIFNPTVISRPDYGTDPGALRDVGSGPFQVTNFVPSSFVELERFDGFFDEVRLDELRFENFEDSSSMALALRSGDVDAGYGLSRADHEALASDSGFVVSVYEPSFNVFFRFAPPKTPALEDARVREAVMLAMNRPAYRDAFFSAGTAHEPTAQAGLHPERPGFLDDLEERPYDPDRARDLLADAGFDRVTVRLTGYPSAPQIPEQAALLQAMQADLQAVGIEAEVNITDIQSWASTRFEYDMWLSAFAPESSSFTFASLYAPPAQAGAQWAPNDPRSHPDVARLLAEGQAAPDSDEQDRIFQELARLEHEELVMHCPVAQVSSSLVARAGVHDLRVTTLGPAYQAAWVDGA